MGYTYESGIQFPISGIVKKEFPISQYDSLTSLSVPLVFITNFVIFFFYPQSCTD
jgi:hypothetical protein